MDTSTDNNWPGLAVVGISGCIGPDNIFILGVNSYNCISWLVDIGLNNNNRLKLAGVIVGGTVDCN